jgi:hypothetical protein
MRRGYTETMENIEKFLYNVNTGMIKKADQDLVTSHYAFELGLIDIDDNGKIKITSAGWSKLLRQPARRVR